MLMNTIMRKSNSPLPVLLFVSITIALLAISILFASSTSSSSSFSVFVSAEKPLEPDEPQEHHHFLHNEQPHLSNEEMAQKLKDESQARLRECHSPFGSLNGITSTGVAAYSNCNDNTITMEDNEVIFDKSTRKVFDLGDPVGEDLFFNPAHKDDFKAIKVTTGMKWQCVEFARRFLLQMYGLIFQDCPGAMDIWRMTFLFRPKERDLLQSNPTAMQRFKFDRYPNFATDLTSIDLSDQPHTAVTSAQPQANDIFVHPIQKDMPFGHVGVIVEVLAVDRDGNPVPASSSRYSSSSSSSLPIKPVDTSDPSVQSENKDTLVGIARIAEQNYQNKDWSQTSKDSSRTFARELHVYRRAKTNRLALKDPDGYKLLGWMRARPNMVFHGAFSHVDDGLDLDVQGATNGLPKRVYASEANTLDFKPGEGITNNNEEKNVNTDI